MEANVPARLPPAADGWTVWSPSFQVLRSNSSPSLFLGCPLTTMLPLTWALLPEKHLPSANVTLRWDVMSAFVVFPCLFGVYCNTPMLLKPKSARQAGTCTFLHDATCFSTHVFFFYSLSGVSTFYMQTCLINWMLIAAFPSRLELCKTQILQGKTGNGNTQNKKVNLGKSRPVIFSKNSGLCVSHHSNTHKWWLCFVETRNITFIFQKNSNGKADTEAWMPVLQSNKGQKKKSFNFFFFLKAQRACINLTDGSRGGAVTTPH